MLQTRKDPVFLGLHQIDISFQIIPMRAISRIGRLDLFSEFQVDPQEQTSQNAKSMSYEQIKSRSQQKGMRHEIAPFRACDAKYTRPKIERRDSVPPTSKTKSIQNTAWHLSSHLNNTSLCCIESLSMPASVRLWICRNKKVGQPLPTQLAWYKAFNQPCVPSCLGLHTNGWYTPDRVVLQERWFLAGQYSACETVG